MCTFFISDQHVLPPVTRQLTHRESSVSVLDEGGPGVGRRPRVPQPIEGGRLHVNDVRFQVGRPQHLQRLQHKLYI